MLISCPVDCSSVCEGVGLAAEGWGFRVKLCRCGEDTVAMVVVGVVGGEGTGVRGYLLPE